RPNLTRLLPLALSRDLRNERDIRLRDAGQETEKPIFIDRVFVDLPVRVLDEVTISSIRELEQTKEDDLSAQEAGGEDDEEEEEEGENGEREEVRRIRRAAWNITNLVQIRASDKLDPEACALQRPHGPRPNRIVLLGGPGQGKSTISQFLCQLSRARL